MEEIDKTLLKDLPHAEPEEQDDNVRIYVPLDLNKEAILRPLLIIITISWMAMIFFFSAQPSENSAELSGTTGEKVLDAVYPGFRELDDAVRLVGSMIMK